MPQSESTPRLPKWPFLVGDAALLAAAWLIADNARHPLSETAIVSIVICVVLGAVAGAIPFLSEYARKTDEALDERQKALEALNRTSAATAEQIGTAASGFNQIAELAQANLAQAEQVQQHLQKTSAEFLSRLATVRTDEKRKLEKDFAALRSAELAQLESVLDKISQASADFRRAQAAPAPRAEAERAASSAVSALPVPEAAPEPPSAPTPPAPEPEPLPSAEPPPEAPAAAEPAPEIAAEAPPKPQRKRAKKLPKPEDSSEAPAEPPPEEAEAEQTDSSTPAEPAFSEAAPEPPAPSEFSQMAPDEGLPATSVSADGATRLIVTAYIGIGNRLFIRGEGPGLNWERGTPLQFVSIGKWRWESPDVTAPVPFKLYKNDEVECTALAAQSIEPGQQQEVAASF